MPSLARWLVIEREEVSEDGRALTLHIRLRWWRWFAPSFWWAALRRDGGTDG